MKDRRLQIPSQYARIGSPDGSDVNQSLNAAVACHSMGCVGMPVVRRCWTTFAQHDVLWLWVPAPVRNYALGRDDDVEI
jgi:hypothetical protein